MSEDAHVVLVGFVDDRTIEIRMKLLDRAAAVVDPDLDQIGLLRSEFAYIGARFIFRGHAVR